ncbi:hypothetical protein BDP27DRAFT_608814 [Rhodocollybia butyracea]|uniref:N-acetyltransferase domain-containing protein n=1 Tax=Rhodocollybia butyracea TaxID=206335 RepID=A0A9P5QBG9_9AGAR|nr:hypothetical protein BDP27DRAFT_608814 [Rhodocollybia butyracea]
MMCSAVFNVQSRHNTSRFLTTQYIIGMFISSFADSQNLDLSSNSAPFVRVRIARKSDSDAIRKLFRICFITGKDSPARAHLSVTIRTPAFHGAFALLILSIAIEIAILFPFSWTQGTSNHSGKIAVGAGTLALLAFSYLCCVIYSSVAFFARFCYNCLREDLKDIPKHYELRPVNRVSNAEENDPELEPTGKKAFWVAEEINPSTGRSAIVGCISLDELHPPLDIQPDLAELCRMCVSPHHRRRGIANALVEACEAHARNSKLNVSAIILRTSFYQPSARRLYTKNFGYKLVLEKTIYCGFERFPGYMYRKELKSQT